MTPDNYTNFDLMALVALCLSLSSEDLIGDPVTEDPIETMLLELCDLDWKQFSISSSYVASSSINGEPVWIVFYHRPPVYEQNFFGTLTNKIIHPSRYILSFYSQDPSANNYTSAYKYLIQTIESIDIDSRYTQTMSDVYAFVATTVASNFANRFIGS